MPVAPLAINALPTRADADSVLRLTAAYREHTDAHPARREAACLRAQFPGILQPIRDGDVFAGRRSYPPVCYDPDMMGGYFLNEQGFGEMMDALADDDPRRPALDEAREFWQRHASPVKVRRAFPKLVHEALPEDGHLKAKHPAYPLYRQGGTTADYAKLVNQGIPGLAREVEEHLEEDPANPFLNGCRDALETLSDCFLHYAGEARTTLESTEDADARRRLEHIAAACEALRFRAPGTLFESLQLIWLYSLVSSTQNFGRLDIALAPALMRDREDNGLDDEVAVQSLCGFWRMADEELNLMNARIVIGGVGRPDEVAADAVAHLMIEAARRTRVTRPQLSLRWHEGLSPALWDDAIDCIACGTTFPILYSDPANVPGVASAYKVDHQMAESYVPYGCGEYVLGPASLSSPNGIINLLKCLELALFNGVDPKSGERMGPPTETIQTFDDLWNAYTRQVEFLTPALAHAQRIQHETNAGDFAMLLTGLLMDDCLGRGASPLAGGVRYAGGILESYGNTNTADALTAIRDTVFKRGEATLDEIRQAMRDGFAGFEPLRNRLLKAPKYGNNDDTADAMVLRVHNHICDACRRAGEKAGLPYYLPVMINNWNNTAQGHACIASADGRRDGDPLVSGNGALPGADVHGPTALALSLAKLPNDQHAGAVQNMKFDARMFRRHRTKLKALLETYFLGGGTQAMLTVVSREDLLDAMEHPERHPNLLVRIGGFSARFVSLPREVQMEVMARTMN